MKAYHTLVAGDSGGGKTTLLREMHAKYHRRSEGGISIVINHTRERGFAGYRAGGHKAIRTALDKGRHEINFISKKNIVQQTAFIRQISHEINDKLDRSVQVIIDEAHVAMPDKDSSAAGSNPVAAMLHEDRDKGIKVVVASQDPGELYKPPLKQCRYFIWVGKPAPWHEGFARYYRLKDAQLPSKDYEYVVLEKGEGFTWTTAYRGVTSSYYA